MAKLGVREVARRGRKQGSLVVAAGILLGAAASAASAQGSNYHLFDHVSVVLGGYFETTDANIRLDGTETDLGVPIDLEGELGLDESDTLFRGRLEFLPGERHQWNLGYYTLEREATRRLSRDIEFGDEVFPISAEVKAFTDLEVIEGSYTFWFVRGERAAWGGTIGLVYLGVEAGIEVEALGIGLGLVESASTDLPVPVVGIAARFGLLERLILHFNAELLPGVTVGDYEGSLANYAAGLEWRAFEHLGFGVGYNFFDVDLDVEKESFRGNLDYQMQGAQIYLRLGF